MAKNHSTSHLQSPAVRKKRAAAIRRAWRKRKALVPLDAIPGERAPLLVHAAPRRRDDDRVELAKGIVALLCKVLR